MKAKEKLGLLLLVCWVVIMVILAHQINEWREPQGMEYYDRVQKGQNCVPANVGGYYCDDPTKENTP